MFIAFTQDLSYNHFASADTERKAKNLLCKSVRDCGSSWFKNPKVYMTPKNKGWGDNQMTIEHSDGEFNPEVTIIEVTPDGIGWHGNKPAPSGYMEF